MATEIQTIKASQLVELTEVTDSNYVVVTDGATSKIVKATKLKGNSLTSIQRQQLSAAYTHSQTTHVQSKDIPTKTSQLANDSGFVNGTYVTNAINDAQLGSGGNGGLTSTQQQQLNTAYNHSRSPHVKTSDIPTKTSQLTNDSKFVTETELETELINKVDKVSGKGLSTNDLTNEMVTKINNAATQAYVTNAIAEAQLDGSDVDLSGLATKDELNEKAPLTHSHNMTDISDLQDALDSKVDAVSGKSLVSDTEIARLANVNNYDDSEIRGLIPTKTSQLTNDSNYLTSVPSEYVTETELNNKGYATTSEVDQKISTVDLSGYALKTEIPTDISQLNNDSNYLTSVPSEYITETELNTSLSNKVDKEAGYSLVSDAEIARLANVDNYDDTEVRGLIPTKHSDLTNDSNYLTSVPSEYVTEEELSNKGYATTTEVDRKITEAVSSGTVDLSGYALKTEVPTKTSQLTNDSNYLTTIPSEYVTETELNTSLSNKVDKISGYSLVSDAEISRLANVDNYDDTELMSLIPDKTSDLENDSNFISSNDEIDATTLNGKTISEPMTKEEYDAIDVKDPNTIYLVDDETALEGIPSYSVSDAGKVLAVNSTGTGLVWVTLSSPGGGSEEPKTLTSISAIYNQGSTTVYPSTNLDSLKSNLTVTATYSDKSTSIISNGYSLSGNLTVGTSTITVTYLEKTATFNVNVSEEIIPTKNLTSITAVYTQGDTVVYPSTALNKLKTNLVVTANYDDDSTETVTDYTLSGELTVGTSTITVTYLEKTATFNVNVSEPIPIEGIVSNPVFYVDARYGQSTSVLAWDNMGTATMPTIIEQGPKTEDHPDRGFINGALVDKFGQFNFTWSGLPALNDFTTELNCKLGSRGTAAGMALDSGTNPGSIYQQQDDTNYLIWAVEKQYYLERTVNDKDCIQIRRHGATVEIFKNGQLATTITDAYAGATKATQLKTVGFIGEVYSIIIYDRMLSDEELQQNIDYEASLNRRS